jgi:hypothetical protein
VEELGRCARAARTVLRALAGPELEELTVVIEEDDRLAIALLLPGALTGLLVTGTGDRDELAERRRLTGCRLRWRLERLRAQERPGGHERILGLRGLGGGNDPR